MQRIQIYPIPDSILTKVRNKIEDESLEFIKRIFPHIENNYLGKSDSLLSPVIKIQNSK